MGSSKSKSANNIGESAPNAPPMAPLHTNIYESILPPDPNELYEDLPNDDIIPADKKIVLGVYNYEASVDGDVSFIRGDRMVVLSDTDKDWLTVRHLSTHQEGLIPSNFVAEETPLEKEEWFFGEKSRQEAEELLLNSDTPRGCFLIRNSQQDPDGFILCVKDLDDTRGNHVKHYRIKPVGNGKGYFITLIYWFPSLQALVQAYTKKAMGLCHALTVPCPKPRPKLQDQWEIDRNEITFNNKLANGVFIEVWFGMWKNTPVVAKMPKPEMMSNEEFLEETAIMKNLSHNRLVALYGVCTQDEPILIVQEFMNNGSLLNFLRSPAGKALSLNDLFHIAAQTASGMDYLEKQNIIHRRLQAKNIFVGDNNTVKIGNFCLARVMQNHDEYCPKSGRCAKKWTAPEVIFHERFSMKSDVWSYGILLMEIFTFGQVPYPGLNSMQVIHALKRGYRMPKPTSVPLPNMIYDTMLKCWDQFPEKRPTFESLRNFFDDDGRVYDQDYLHLPDSFCN